MKDKNSRMIILKIPVPEDHQVCLDELAEKFQKILQSSTGYGSEYKLEEED